MWGGRKRQHVKKKLLVFFWCEAEGRAEGRGPGRGERKQRPRQRGNKDHVHYMTRAAANRRVCVAQAKTHPRTALQRRAPSGNRRTIGCARQYFNQGVL